MSGGGGGRHRGGVSGVRRWRRRLGPYSRLEGPRKEGKKGDSVSRRRKGGTEESGRKGTSERERKEDHTRIFIGEKERGREREGDRESLSGER